MTAHACDSYGPNGSCSYCTPGLRWNPHPAPPGMRWEWSVQHRTMDAVEWTDWVPAYPHEGIRPMAKSDAEAVEHYEQLRVYHENIGGLRQFRYVRRLVGEFIPVDHELHWPYRSDATVEQGDNR